MFLQIKEEKKNQKLAVLLDLFSHVCLHQFIKCDKNAIK